LGFRSPPSGSKSGRWSVAWGRLCCAREAEVWR
jgi:hypothetical protein